MISLIIIVMIISYLSHTKRESVVRIYREYETKIELSMIEYNTFFFII
jgi:hypothetical protein